MAGGCASTRGRLAEPLGALDCTRNRGDMLYFETGDWFHSAVPEEALIGAQTSYARAPFPEPGKSDDVADRWVGLRALPKALSRRQKRRQAAEQRAASAGPAWYGLRRPELTQKLKEEIEIVNLMHLAESGRFRKASADYRNLKHFAIGTTVASAADFYSDPGASSSSGRVRGPTALGLADSLIQSTQLKQQLRKRFLKIQAAKQRDFKLQHALLAKKRTFAARSKR